MRTEIYPILWQGRETHKPDRLSGRIVTISDTVVTKWDAVVAGKSVLIIVFFFFFCS